MTEAATVEQRAGELIVVSYSFTDAGFQAMNGHFTRLPEAVHDRDLGDAIEDALIRSRQRIAVPNPHGSLPAKPLLDLLGLGSYSEYMKGTRVVEVRRDGEVTRVIPTRNGGAHEGFVDLPEHVRTLQIPSEAELAAAVRDALLRSV